MPSSDSTTGKVIIVHPTGNENVRHAVQALNECGRLDSYHTSISWNSTSTINHLLPNHLRSLLSRRSYPSLPTNLVHTHPLREIARLLSIQFNFTNLYRNELGHFCFESVTDALDNSVAQLFQRMSANSQMPAAIYSYDGCALNSFIEAKRRGIRCLYDAPATYYRSYIDILSDEIDLNPEWSLTWTGRNDSKKKLERKDREFDLADAIFVSSTFSEQSLRTCPTARDKIIYKIPYGAPSVGPTRSLTHKTDPLRILFVGSLTQRKGISYLFQSVEQLSFPYQLTVVGRGSYYPKVLKDALAHHHWIDSASHSEVLRLMRENDVLVFPTLSDAFGLIILEAMSQGAVVITTPNSAAPDIIDNHVDGIIVPIRSSDAICQALEHLSNDREYLYKMSEAAQRKSEEHSWETYRTILSTSIVECIS